MSSTAQEGEHHRRMTMSQRLAVWAAPVMVFIAIPLNVFAGFTTMLIVLGVVLVAWIVLLLAVIWTERRREDATTVGETEPNR
ncbi:hypothetical protein ACX80L_05315 [Arthrobacter sp. MDT1-48-3]